MPTPNIQVISGTPNTGTENSSVLMRDVDPLLYYYRTDKHPIVSMVLTFGMDLQPEKRENSYVPRVVGRSLKKKVAKNWKFEHFEDQVELKEEYTPTAAVASNDTSITVSASDDDHFQAGDALLLTNAAGQMERVLVSSVSANTLNITNSDGSTRTSGIAMTTGDKFYKLEFVRSEDSSAPAIRTTKRAEMYNYLEYVTESYGLTEAKSIMADYNGDPLMREKRLAVSRFLTKLEKMFFFGERAVANASTNPKYSSGGLKYFMELYSDVEIRDMAGKALTRAELNSFLTAVGKGGSTEKWLVCDSRSMSAINNMGYADVKVDNYRVGEFGMNIKKIWGPLGVVTLVYEPLFDEIAPMRGSMMVIDPDHITYRYLPRKNGGDIKDEVQLLSDGNSAIKRMITGYVGWQFSTMKTMGWMKNIGA